MHSMARTTGFPCAIMARAIANKLVIGKGILAPETLSCQDALYDFIIAEHQKRGVMYRAEVENSLFPGFVESHSPGNTVP
jgi:saccharopine dehydrogenase-like NADP-dependent oxidoreductase